MVTISRSMRMAKVVSQTTRCRFAGVWCWNCSYHTLLQKQIPDHNNGSAVKSVEDHQPNNQFIIPRLVGITKPVNRMLQLGTLNFRTQSYGAMARVQTAYQNDASTVACLHDQNKAVQRLRGKNPDGTHSCQIGENVSRKDKIKFLVSTLLDLNDSKEAIYGALDSWVAWEQNFPIGSLKNVLLALEKEQQWHRIIQVIKWMLSKGQGNTMGTYGQLIQALDMDHRAEEAHKFWMKKIGSDLHSVPWQLCRSMIAIYYRNNMLENLVKLFKVLEAFDRKPTEKSVVQKVADAYEMLGLLEEKDRVLEKYKSLLTERGSPKKSENLAKKKKSKKLVNTKKQ